MNERYYTDKGLISKGSSLNIQGADGLYSLLIPVIDMPETAGAPSTQDKTVLSDKMVTQCEGLQTLDQKTYTFNWHRDNIRALKKVKGKAKAFLERDGEDNGIKFSGTLNFARSGLSVDGVQQGTIYITVSNAEEDPIEMASTIMKKTAIIETPLSDVSLVGTESYELATAAYSTGKLTITGVAAGQTMVELTVSADGEATSYRSIAVTVLSAD